MRGEEEGGVARVRCCGVGEMTAAGGNENAGTMHATHVQCRTPQGREVWTAGPVWRSSVVGRRDGC